MSNFEWIVLAVGILILNIGWWEAYYEINMMENKNE